jgi:hypothetical protein
MFYFRKKIYVLAIALMLMGCISSNLYGQQIYEGQVVDKLTELPVSAVTVRLMKQNIALATNDQGYFKLIATGVTITDTIVFTSVGYETYKLPVNAYQSQMFIKMEPSNILLNNVIIREGKIKYITLEKFSISDIKEARFQGHTINPTISFFSHHSFAKLFVAPHDNAQLVSIQMGRRDYLDFESNKAYTTTNKSARFLLNIMSVDPRTGGPDKLLYTKEITLQDNSLMVSVDLSKDKIVIPTAKFFIGIEWLQIPFNEVINLNPIKRVEKINKKGEQIMEDVAQYSILYQPFLVTYDHPFYIPKYSIALSATIFY